MLEPRTFVLARMKRMHRMPVFILFILSILAKKWLLLIF